jgi:hypothetical protein
MMMPTAFDTDIPFVAVTLRVSILLTSGALRYASGSSWGFELNNLVLYGDDVVNVFIIACWFKIYIEKAKSCCDCSFLNIVRMYGNLVVSPHKVNFRKDGAAGKVVSVVLYLWDRVPVRNCARVKGSGVSAWPPTPVLLWYEMQG